MRGKFSPAHPQSKPLPLRATRTYCSKHLQQLETFTKIRQYTDAVTITYSRHPPHTPQVCPLLWRNSLSERRRSWLAPLPPRKQARPKSRLPPPPCPQYCKARAPSRLPLPPPPLLQPPLPATPSAASGHRCAGQRGDRGQCQQSRRMTASLEVLLNVLPILQKRGHVCAHLYEAL